MSRLIDADELIEVIEHRADEAGRGDFDPLYIPTVDDIEEMIYQAPTVNLWHYPSKGDYPKEGEEVLFRCDGQNYLGTYSDTSYYFDSRDMGSPAAYVECWQYIVPPKEEV